AFLDGLVPGCGASAQARPPGETDPLFDPFDSGIGPPDQSLAAAAVLGQIGGRPQSLIDLYRPALEQLERVLLGCVPGRDCPHAAFANASVLTETMELKPS